MKEMDERFKNEIAKLKASDRDLSLQIATISSKFNTTVEGINSRGKRLAYDEDLLMA
jgi:archaellum component FlaC